jgi:uncharacterized protein (TIGR02246 family)
MRTILLVAMLAPAHPLPAQSAPVPPEVRQALLAAMQRYTGFLKSVNSDSVAASFTADGELLEPGMAPLHGRSAIRAFLSPFDGKVTVDTAESVTDTIEAYGPIAYLWGSYHQVARMGEAAPSAFDGRFVAQWRLEADGKWRMSRLLMQPAPPR